MSPKLFALQEQFTTENFLTKAKLRFVKTWEHAKKQLYKVQ